METNRLDQAYQYCEWITYHHYENFPVASLILPKGKRPHIAAIYAFARSADDFADEGKYKGRSLDLLNGWRLALHLCSKNDSSHPIFIALGDTIRRCTLPVQLLDDLLTAFTMDVTKRRYADWDELFDYCRYSANPVGRLVLMVFDHPEPKLLEFSDHICTGLQLTNHWQDLRIDLKRDILYIPQSLLKNYDIEERDLTEWHGRTITGRFRELMKELIRQARVEFDKGEPLLKYLSGRLRFEIKLTLAGGREILKQIEAADYDVYRHRPVLTTSRKLKVLTRALLP